MPEGAQMGLRKVGKMEMGFTCVHIAASPPVSLTGSDTHLHRLPSRGTVGGRATPHGGARAQMPPICTYIPKSHRYAHM